MSELSYKPTNKAFDGIVKINVPKYKERIGLIRSLKFETAVVDGVSKVNALEDSLLMAEKMLDLVSSRVTSVNLKHVQSGVEFKAIEDLEMYREGNELIGEIGQVILNGVSLGNG